MRWSAGILWLLLVASAGAGEPGIALAARGKVFTGPVSLDARGLAVGGTVLALDELAAAAFPTPVAVPAWIDQGAVSIQGDQLRGLPRSFDKGQLELASDSLGTVVLGQPKLAGIVLSPVRLTALVALLRGKPGALLANGDRAEGSLAFLNAEMVGIDNGRRIVQVPRSRVVVVVVRPVDTDLATRPRLWLRLINGDRLGGDAWKSAAAAVGIETGLGAFTIPAAAVAAIAVEGGRTVPLTRVVPTRLAAKDRLGTDLPILYDAASDGGWLIGGGLRGERGLQLPARGEGAWPVAGYAILLAWAACPAGSTGGHLQILLDGQIAWDSGPMLPGQPPRPIEVPLKGARELSVLSLPANDGETILRSAAFCSPVLIK